MSIDQLRAPVRRLAAVCEERMLNWMLANKPGADDLVEVLPAVAGAYTQSAALLAADWYNDQDSDSDYFAAPVDVLVVERMADTARWIYAGPQTPANRARVAAQKLVLDAARNTISENARAEGVAVVRQEYVGACDDCVARATLSATRSRGGGSDGVFAEFHPGCTGMLVAVRTGVWQPPDYVNGWRTRINAAHKAGNTAPDDVAIWLSDNYSSI